MSLRDGATDSYMRSGDAYVKHNDGTLEVIRVGAKRLSSYAPVVWIDVQGDEKRSKGSRFGG